MIDIDEKYFKYISSNDSETNKKYDCQLKKNKIILNKNGLKKIITVF